MVLLFDSNRIPKICVSTNLTECASALCRASGKVIGTADVIEVAEKGSA